MHAAAEGIVRPPAVDQPALADPITAILFTNHSRRVKSAGSGIFYGLMFLIPVAAIFSGGMPSGPGQFVLAGIFLACALAWSGSSTLAYVWYGRWMRRARSVLASQPWRPVSAAVTERGDVEVREGADSWRLQVPRMFAAAVQVIAQTGRVWLVGPDAKGWLTVRVDGVHAPWPGRRAPIRPGSPPRTPLSPGTTGTAVDDPVTALWAASLARLTLVRILPYAFFALTMAAGAVALVLMTGLVAPWLVVGVVLIVPPLIATLHKLRANRDHRTLRAFLAAGPWQRLTIRLQPWEPNPTGMVETGGTVWLAHGGSREITLPGVTIDLLGNIGETGTLWVAGEPAPGRKLAVGFPGYPVLGVAVFS